MAKSTSSLASTTSTSSSTSASSASSTSAATAGSGRHQLHLKSASSIDRRKRLAANARERKRMHLLNKAYDELRLRLADAENKSKYDVLVQAKEYIQALAAICERFDQQHPNHHLQPVSSGNQLPVSAAATAAAAATTSKTHIPDHQHHQDLYAKPVDMTAKPYSAAANHLLHLELKPVKDEQDQSPKGVPVSQAHRRPQRLNFT